MRLNARRCLAGLVVVLSLVQCNGGGVNSPGKDILGGDSPFGGDWSRIEPEIQEDQAAFDTIADKAGLTGEQIAGICAFLDTPADERITALARMENVEAERQDLERLQAYLEAMGAGDYFEFDWHIVRGLAYYTGIVYEVFDADASLRAVAGGGRYDNLLEVLGGPKVGATGFGMGDVVLGILLKDTGKLPDGQGRLDYFVIDDEGCSIQLLLHVVGELRKRGLSGDFSYKRQNTGKQLKEANRRNAASAVIVPGANEPIRIKDLATGDQTEQTLDEFLRLQDKDV